jgi:SlyX protein
VPTAVYKSPAEICQPAIPKVEPRVLEERIIELEVKNAFLSEALDQLNAVVVRQQQQIDLLIREVMGLKAQAGASDVLRPDNLAEEIPPHY